MVPEEAIENLPSMEPGFLKPGNYLAIALTERTKADLQWSQAS